jgi:hypothetical protein
VGPPLSPAHAAYGACCGTLTCIPLLTLLSNARGERRTAGIYTYSALSHPPAPDAVRVLRLEPVPVIQQVGRGVTVLVGRDRRKVLSFGRHGTGGKVLQHLAVHGRGPWFVMQPQQSLRLRHQQLGEKLSGRQILVPVVSIHIAHSWATLCHAVVGMSQPTPDSLSLVAMVFAR